MPYIPNVNPNELVESAWGNTIRDHVVHRFASVAARTAAVPAPVEGMVTYLADNDRLEVWSGTRWLIVNGAVPLGAGQAAMAGTYTGQPLQTLGWIQSMGAAADGTFTSAFAFAVAGVLVAQVGYIGPFAVNCNVTGATTAGISGIALQTTNAVPVTGTVAVAFMALVWY